MARQAGFWDYEEHLARLTKGGDPLVTLAAVVDFEPFRYRLEKALKRSDGLKGGRPPYDPVLMFKILVLQALHNLSDDQAEFQIRDRLSFMRFLGLAPNAPSPDAKTIWLFREHLVQARAIEKLFALFDARLTALPAKEAVQVIRYNLSRSSVRTALPTTTVTAPPITNGRLVPPVTEVPPPLPSSPP